MLAVDFFSRRGGVASIKVSYGFRLQTCGFLGLTYGFKWNTNNVVEASIKFEDKPVQGITSAAELQFVPLTG